VSFQSLPLDRALERRFSLAELTEAEQRVVRLAMVGLSNRAIAALRSSAQRTIENQLTSAYKKLGLSGRRELKALGAEAPRAPRGRSLALTHRELRILELVDTGQSNKVIASAMGVSLSTISSTLTRVRQKLRARLSRGAAS